mmetsp:Transcript_12779/g.40375  ORF Transcript_12779/g.40375 Transcript_12779/m.40375 type:complete len:272 (+) Transcript_12779:121-936(+)
MTPSSPASRARSGCSDCHRLAREPSVVASDSWARVSIGARASASPKTTRSRPSSGALPASCRYESSSRISGASTLAGTAKAAAARGRTSVLSRKVATARSDDPASIRCCVNERRTLAGYRSSDTIMSRKKGSMTASDGACSASRSTAVASRSGRACAFPSEMSFVASAPTLSPVTSGNSSRSATVDRPRSNASTMPSRTEMTVVASTCPVSAASPSNTRSAVSWETNVGWARRVRMIAVAMDAVTVVNCANSGGGDGDVEDSVPLASTAPA